MAVAVAVKRWTLEELHSLPDDGNKYELINGELFVTPAPAYEHERLAAKLTRILEPYVARHALGYVFHPRAVFQRDGSETEPDAMVVPETPKGTVDWNTAPTPLLVVEIVSPTTRRRDREHKRRFYLEHDVPEYWIVDPERAEVLQVLAGSADATCRDRLLWKPQGASDALTIDVPALFS